MKIITISDMLSMCGTTRRHIQEMINDGKLPFVFMVGRTWACHESDFKGWLKANPQYQKISFTPNLEPTLDSIVLDLKKTLSQVETLLKKQNEQKIFGNPIGRVPNPVKPTEVESNKSVPTNGIKIDINAIKTEVPEFKWKT